MGFPICRQCHNWRHSNSGFYFWHDGFWASPNSPTEVRLMEARLYAALKSMEYVAEFLSINKGKKI
jgi:hypothetical protein